MDGLFSPCFSMSPSTNHARMSISLSTSQRGSHLIINVANSNVDLRKTSLGKTWTWKWEKRNTTSLESNLMFIIFSTEINPCVNDLPSCEPPWLVLHCGCRGRERPPCLNSHNQRLEPAFRGRFPHSCTHRRA